MLEPTPPPPTASAPDIEAVPDVATFAASLASGKQRPSALRKLHGRLCAIDPRADLFAREDALVGLATWVRKGGDVPPPPGAATIERAAVRRFRLLVRALDEFPTFRRRLSHLLRRVLREQAAHGFFAKMGIPGDRGLLSETIDRLSRRLMPQPIDEQEITQLLTRMFPSHADVEWLAELPTDEVRHFLAQLEAPDAEVDRAARGRGSLPSRGDLPLGAMPSIPDDRASLPPSPGSPSVFSPMRGALLEAILLLASRVSSAGLSDAIRVRSPACKLHDSPFFKLPRAIDALLATPRDAVDEIALLSSACQELVDACRETAAAVLVRLESTGVSVDVVYRLELVDRSLRRIEILFDVLVPRDKHELARRSVQLLGLLLEERRRDLSLTDIVGTNTRLLARKVIERAGQTGEHYITATPGEYVRMFLSAAGGGVMTALTATLKFAISALHRPPLQEGLLASANYAGSFLVMQLLGFTLATKQPSMTAAALAGALKEDSTDHATVITTVARLVRSQIAAAAGNVILVIPASVAVDRYLLATQGRHLLDATYADKTLKSLHPTESGTILFAAVTGVILWLSSLAAGWLENWAVYRRLPEAIAEHRLRRYLGQRVTSWASRVFARNVAGVGGNVAIGLMLGLTPILGQFAGVPIEVRHVTLSTGSLTFAVLALGEGALSSPDLLAAAAGIVLILVLNLGVSFAFAFSIALRAREVTIVEGLKLGVAIALGFVRSPFRFFVPVEPRGAQVPTGAPDRAPGH